MILSVLSVDFLVGRTNFNTLSELSSSSILQRYNALGKKEKACREAGFDEVTANATYIGSVLKTNANNQCASPSSVPLKSMPMGDWKTRRPKVGITANTCSKISLCRCS